HHALLRAAKVVSEQDVIGHDLLNLTGVIGARCSVKWAKIVFIGVTGALFFSHMIPAGHAGQLLAPMNGTHHLVTRRTARGSDELIGVQRLLLRIDVCDGLPESFDPVIDDPPGLLPYVLIARPVHVSP